MSAPLPLESEYLRASEHALTLAASSLGGASREARLQLLEACSSRFGGFDLERFHSAFSIQPLGTAKALLALAAPVAALIEATPIHPALALSALAREVLAESDRKTTGAYHTDFRLANRVAALAATKLTHLAKVVDPACGAGILLTALTIAVCGRDRKKISEWLANGVCAADLSAHSLRSSVLALASLTDDVQALVEMRARWYCGDSLLAGKDIWRSMAPRGFDGIVANPPWEKVKLTRHEFLKAEGSDSHYGAATGDLDEKKFDAKKSKVADYSRALLDRYPDLAKGEPDLYIAFTSLCTEICRPGGVVAALVPGGLIRSQGTRAMREGILQTSEEISISIFDNRAKFFSIDTRFKFLCICLVKSDDHTPKFAPIKLFHERGTAHGVETSGASLIGRKTLQAIRSDLSIPEVRSQAEWKLFLKASQNAVAWTDGKNGWEAKFAREVDMTKERPKFLSKPTKSSLPLVEGRMVHNHRFGVKGHRSGTGRKALWDACPIGGSQTEPQFWIKADDVPLASRSRVRESRIGFCDIAGQTNERSLMATMIPPNVVCGNKVPTIVFGGEFKEERSFIWLAIANSFVFDWLLRRVLTTTVNYFVLQSVPLPKLTVNGLPWQKLLDCSREISSLDRAGATSKIRDRMASVRAEIDAEVAIAYGLTLEDMALMMSDFPLLDRGQPALETETRSTVTTDYVMASLAKRVGSGDADYWMRRTELARSAGATAYVPSEASDLVGEDVGARRHA